MAIKFISLSSRVRSFTFRRRPLAEGEEVIDSAHNYQPVGDGRRRHHHLADGVCGQQLVLWSGFDDENITILARQINLPIRGYWRTRECATLAAESLLISALPGLRIVGCEHALVRAGIKVTAVDNGRRHVRPAALLTPRDELV